MLPHPDDTIVAVASAAGGAPRGIVRVGGPRLLDTLQELWPDVCWPTVGMSRRLSTPLNLNGWRRPIPCDVLIWPTSRSYTGQPLAELHLPGSPPLLEVVVIACRRAGARLAQPGEFTLRAFLSGRVDLTQAEAILAVIDAGSPSELQAALDQLAGGLSSQMSRLRGDLLELLADLEAGLDFAHEEIEFVGQAELIRRLSLAGTTIAGMISQAGGRMRPARIPRVVLAGPPNAGKSSLFNVLAGRPLAIVSPEEGTTRDFLVAEVCWDGRPLLLIDTAGAQDPADTIETQAQAHRICQTQAADLVLWCRPASEPRSGSDRFSPDGVGQVLRVATKCDEPGSPAPGEWNVSAHTGEGLDTLQKAVGERLRSNPRERGAWLESTAARGVESLEQAAEALRRAAQAAETEADQALLAIEIREALDALGTITGAACTDDILDRIFSRFCIGK